MEVEFGQRQLERCYLSRSDAVRFRLCGPVVGAKYGRFLSV